MPRFIFRKVLLLCVTTVLVTGCDVAGLDDFVEEVAVSSVLIAGELLPQVRLNLTGAIDQPYNANQQGINNAEVLLQVVADNGEVTFLPYVLSPRERGIYIHEFPEDSVRVEGGATYRLQVVVPSFPDTIRAETVVPETFSISRALADTLFYQVGDSPTMDITRTSYPGRQSRYVFTVGSLESDLYPLTPFAADLVGDRGVSPEDLRLSSSPILNEENFTVNPDGTLEISVVWLSFNFYGPQSIQITELDDAMINFVQSQIIQFLPTTLSPGEIPNVVSNVENGVGVFGAASQVTGFTFLEPAP